jgi:threonine/homoserine/homoserine lactone efflux protein
MCCIGLVGDDTLSWEKITARGDLPLPRSGHTMSFVNSKVIVFGGQTGCGFVNDVRILNLGRFGELRMVFYVCLLSLLSFYASIVFRSHVRHGWFSLSL